MITRIAVTGANGFIGKHLCEYLSHGNYDVIAITRAKNIPNWGAVTSRVVPDLAELDETSCIFEGCDAVIHLAGRAHIPDDLANDPLAEFRRINVDITRNLILSAARVGVKRFVFVSSIGVNGNRTEIEAFSESDTENPHDLYAISKLEAERVVRSQAKQCGIEFVIVRPTLVFGPDAPGNFGLLMKIAAKGLPIPFGGMSARRNLVSVWNLVDFLQVCATHSAATGETFLVADEQDIMLPEIFKYLGMGMNKKQRIFFLPEKFLRGAAFLLGKNRLFEKLNAELRVDITKAKTVLGWKPRYSSFECLERAGREYMAGKRR